MNDREQHEPELRIAHLTSANEIRIRPVKWHWFERLALGTLALLGGREGIGKTICAYTLAADTTRGRLPGANKEKPRGVIIAATEDSWEHTIVPRLMAADADLTRVFRVDVLTPDGIETNLVLPTDLAELKRVIRIADAAFVILDPLLSRLDVSLDSHKDGEVRQALEPLVALAGETGACFLGLVHVNKGQSSDALTMLMGSRAFAAVARTVLFVMEDPDDKTRRLLGTPKNNLGRVDLPTLAFQIVGVKVADTPEGEVWTGKLDWLGETDQSISDAIETAREIGGDRTATSEAGDWLHDYLTSVDAPAESSTIKREGAKAGHSSDSLKRARRKLGIVAQSLGFPRRTFWALSGSNSGRLNSTAPTAPTAPTRQGRPLDLSLSDYQSEQSERSEQSNQVSRRCSHCDALPEGGPCSFCDGPVREASVAN